MTMDRPPAPPPPSDPRDARPARRHDSEAEPTSEPESSRGGMEAPADPQLLLNGAAKEAGRPSPGPPAAAVPVIELVRRGGSLDIKSREAAGEAMQRAPGAEPCRAAEAACEARMVQLSPPALPLQPPGRAMLYNLGQPLATINRSVCPPLSHPHPGAVSRGVPRGVGAAGGAGGRCGGRSSSILSSARGSSLKSSHRSLHANFAKRERGKAGGNQKKKKKKKKRKIRSSKENNLRGKVLGRGEGSGNKRTRTGLALPSSPGSLCSPTSPADERRDSKALTGAEPSRGCADGPHLASRGKLRSGDRACPKSREWGDSAQIRNLGLPTPLTSPCPRRAGVSRCVSPAGRVCCHRTTPGSAS
ncbi:T-cell acute lymphocytic leukemia protein 1 isoform X2 [Ammospiza nelsoni]|uniref:T-cell acute lymphocytic leukemia protein 1 isoform X2 n=1 Tax=Ammospiza nelsoni TaxID=2857394 RepID=UPI00286B224B|nr:T-cell acute lymphocytic leukemia protein 1 isoform X2 [Ammospiza nelsoni]